MKKCMLCRKKKEENDFYVKKGTPDGLNSCCKKCIKISASEEYINYRLKNMNEKFDKGNEDIVANMSPYSRLGVSLGGNERWRELDNEPKYSCDCHNHSYAWQRNNPCNHKKQTVCQNQNLEHSL